MESSILEVQDIENLKQSMILAQDIVTKNYLYRLGTEEILPAEDDFKEMDINEYIRIFHLRKLVSDKNESVIDKLVTVINATYTSQATLFTLIESKDNVINYYLGVVSKDIKQERYNIDVQGETLKGVLEGNFPGLEFDRLTNDEKTQVFERVFVHNNVTAISGIASIRNEKNQSYKEFVQGIEHLVDSLSGREYSVLVIADPIGPDEIALAKDGYENLYTQLSQFLKTTLSFNETESVSFSRAQTEGITNTIGSSTAKTQNFSTTKGWNASLSYSRTKTKNKGALGAVVGAVGGIKVGAAIGAAAGLPLAAPTSGMSVVGLAGAAGSMGALIGGSLGAALIGSTSSGISMTGGMSGSKTEGSSSTETTNESVSKQNSNTETEGESSSHGRSIQITNENKTVKNVLDYIEKDLERIKKCEAFGAFNCATYVISSDPETNVIVSSGYNALMRGEDSSLQASYMNYWDDSNGVEEIKEYLKKFTHPVFFDDYSSEVLHTPASVINSYEVAVNIGLPKKSISGLPVIETASFGRNVFNGEEITTSKNITLGNIYHMGKEEEIPIKLDLKSLAMHTFVTGSTGSGKSNSIYQILFELKKKGIKYLVVEPAKGEYKYVFGDDANVYGTNPNISPLLKINPFRFPEGVHVLEHIDRLVELFNVCWPMYAAMPAVLKEAVERAYINSGWDLTTSNNGVSDEIYPTFIDVLRELEYVVEHSSFSQEVKDNYVGSLSTRVKSLTNGIYSFIFSSSELGDEALFEKNVIVDLSRVGSMETKSLIMGILVMRLQEYRMTQNSINADLKHVTVLEEAHNLLKRTSTEQSSESSNLIGKSVEMLSNAIAEMRTYGEGFIIADQAPSLLDKSVIRNTNTKIIMRLPDMEDRELVGYSIHLNDEQIDELSRLSTGVAAIYQNNWLESVLGKVKYTKYDNVYKYKKEDISLDNNIKLDILHYLLNRIAGEKVDANNIEKLKRDIIIAPISNIVKRKVMEIIDSPNKINVEDVKSIVYEVGVTHEIELQAEKANTIEEWKNVFLDGMKVRINDFSLENQNIIIESILLEQIERYNKPIDYLEKWKRFVRGEIV